MTSTSTKKILWPFFELFQDHKLTEVMLLMSVSCHRSWTVLKFSVRKVSECSRMPPGLVSWTFLSSPFEVSLLWSTPWRGRQSAKQHQCLERPEFGNTSLSRGGKHKLNRNIQQLIDSPNLGYRNDLTVWRNTKHVVCIALNGEVWLAAHEAERQQNSVAWFW